MKRVLVVLFAVMAALMCNAPSSAATSSEPEIVQSSRSHSIPIVHDGFFPFVGLRAPFSPLRNRVTTTADAAGHSSSTTYDLDGQVVETTDKQGATTVIDYDPRGLVSQVQVPHWMADSSQVPARLRSTE